MKKITKKEIIKMLKMSKVDYFYNSDIEFEATLIYKKARFMSHSRAIDLIEQLAYYTDEVHIHLFLDKSRFSFDDEATLKKAEIEIFEISEKLIEIGHEFSSSFISSKCETMFLEYFNPCLKEKDRDKYEEKENSLIYRAIDKHNTMFVVTLGR